MNILTEIMETADYMMDELDKSGFYDQYIFCDAFTLRRELEMQMQRNWEQFEDIYLSDDQFMEIIRKVTEQGVNKTFTDMVMDGTIMMHSINDEGEILYKLNPEIDEANL